MDVGKLSGEVEKFIEAGAALAMQGAIPETPKSRKEKGGSRAPASDSYVAFVEANAVAASYIDWRVAALRRSGNAWRRVRFAYLLGRLSEDPGCVSRWENQRTKSDRANHAAWKKMCRLVADSIHAEHPDVYLRVVVQPKDAPADNPKQAAYRDRRIDTQYANRKIVAELEQVKEETGKSGYELYNELHERVRDDPRRGWSVSKIRYALTQVNRESRTAESKIGSFLDL